MGCVALNPEAQGQRQKLLAEIRRQRAFCCAMLRRWRRSILLRQQLLDLATETGIYTQPLAPSLGIAMSSLLGIMSIAMGGLEAQQAGLETTSNNIANLNTPGYTREQPVLQESAPIINNGIAYGQGVTLQGIESLRDSILDLQINNETQQQGQSQAYVNAMNQVQMLFPDDTSGIGQGISNFFQSLNSLSTDPSNLALRQSVLSAAGGMASAFNSAANQLNAQRSSLDQNVEQTVGEINQITQQIAGINTQLAKLSSTAQGYGSFLDQRNSLVQKLSGLIDVSVINDGSSITLTTKQGALLVADNQGFDLSTALTPQAECSTSTRRAQTSPRTFPAEPWAARYRRATKRYPRCKPNSDSLARGLVQALNTAHAQDRPERKSGRQLVYSSERSGRSGEHGGCHQRSNLARRQFRRQQRQQRQSG